MKTIRRFCAVALSGVIMAAMLAAMPASADTPAPGATPETFVGSANAWALNAEVLSLIKLKAGATNATGDSTPKAHADGAGLSGLAGLGGSGISNADALSPNTSSTPPKACTLSVPLPSILTLDVGCSTSSAATTATGPGASSVSSVVGLDVQLLKAVLDLLKPITDVLAPLLDQTIGSVTGSLQPVLGGILTSLNLGSLGLDLNKPVSSLLTTLQKLTTLATVSILPSISTVTSAAGTVTATAVAKGAEITVLPGLTVLGHALLKISVLAATASATYDRIAAKSTAAIDPSLVTVELLDAAPIKVGLGSPITLLAGTPLESTISLGAGTTAQKPDGSAAAVADGLSIHLLKGISGGINLDLAHAEAAVGGAKAIAAPPTTTTAPPITVPPIHTGKLLLATTGTNLPLLPIGFILILAGYLTRRRLARR